MITRAAGTTSERTCVCKFQGLRGNEAEKREGEGGKGREGVGEGERGREGGELQRMSFAEQTVVWRKRQDRGVPPPPADYTILEV